MIYDITHTTAYDYTDVVSVSHHTLRLKPRELPGQRRLESEITIIPKPAVASAQRDYFGNEAAFVTVEGAHRRLVITARSRVSVNASEPPLPAETPAWESVRDLVRGEQIGAALDASEFIFNSPYVKGADRFGDYAAPSFLPDRPILEAVMDLTRRLYTDFTFDSKATTIATPLEEVFKQRRGVCQDFAHLEIACLRSLGLPARYVSGYIETMPPPGRARLAGADASHAWLSFYCHGLGWIDVDPTNNVIVGNRHITVAWGRDFSDVSPVRGVVLASGDHALRVAVDVIPMGTPGEAAAPVSNPSAVKPAPAQTQGQSQS